MLPDNQSREITYLNKLFEMEHEISKLQCEIDEKHYFIIFSTPNIFHNRKPVSLSNLSLENLRLKIDELILMKSMLQATSKSLTQHIITEIKDRIKDKDEVFTMDLLKTMSLHSIRFIKRCAIEEQEYPLAASLRDAERAKLTSLAELDLLNLKNSI